MPDAYVIEVSGHTAGIVARDSHSNSFNFFSAAPRFNAIEGQRFSDPLAAERAGAEACQIREPPAVPRNGIFPPKHQPETFRLAAAAHINVQVD